MTAHTVPKADMHVHLEGTITPEMARKLAARNGLDLDPGLFTPDGQGYAWHDDGTAQSALLAFVHAYDKVTMVMKTAQDYRDITYDYLTRAAAENCLYSEIMISADHGALIGLTYPDMVAAIAQGIDDARAETGIETRLLSTCVRHYGPEKALNVAKLTRDNPHPYVVGFAVAGDENAYTLADFKEAFDLSGLPYRNAHAGEAAGPESIIAARDDLGVKRFGHMVRVIEDESLMQDLKASGAVPEVCVSSNICLKVFPDLTHHPLRKLFDFGFNVVLGSDDPSFFRTTIGREYQIAQESFDFTDKELLQLTRNAVDCAFLSESEKENLRQRMTDMMQAAA